MGVGRELLYVDCYGRATRCLSKRVAIAHVDRYSSSQVWERKISLTISAVGGAQQREQCLVLIDRQ